jgi:hypothetical protein
VKTGGSGNFQSFIRYRGLPLFLFGTLTLGLAPQALCLRLLRGLKKYHTISTFCAKPDQQTRKEARRRDVLTVAMPNMNYIPHSFVRSRTK